ADYAPDSPVSIAYPAWLGSTGDWAARKPRQQECATRICVGFGLIGTPIVRRHGGASMRRRKGTSLRSLRKVDCDAPPNSAAPRPMRSRGGQTMSFHVGQQVVCVDDKFSKREDWRRTVRVFPRQHSIYTIREIVQEGE